MSCSILIISHALSLLWLFVHPACEAGLWELLITL